jgi:acetyl-CoA C-acetyltransferase
MSKYAACHQQINAASSVFCSAPEYDKQRSPAGVFAEYMGLNHQPTFYVETLCSSSSTGLRLACSLVASGLHGIVAVVGFQKMSEISSAETQERMGRGADIQWESPFGTMMPAYYAMFARAHMETYGTMPEDLALIRGKAAAYGQLNDKAVFRKPVTADMLADPENRMSGPVAAPLRVGDCCANADGSSCLIVACEEKARDLCDKPVWVLGLGAASASVNLAGRDTFTGLSVAREAARQLNKQAVKQHLGMGFSQALAGVSDLFLNTLMKTKDTLEGIRSFEEKRKPQWRNQ